MTNRTRAVRRHHRARVINRAFRLHYITNYDEAVRIHKNMAKCSCSACGNQRHNDWQAAIDALTIQERKAYNSISEGIEDYYDDAI